MEHKVYSRPAWRALPRDRCAVEFLFGPLVGPCYGAIHRHHVDPDDPDSRSIEICASHHPTLQATLRALSRPRRRRCSHRHPYPGGREACERRLNRAA